MKGEGGPQFNLDSLMKKELVASQAAQVVQLGEEEEEEEGIDQILADGTQP